MRKGWGLNLNTWMYRATRMLNSTETVLQSATSEIRHIIQESLRKGHTNNCNILSTIGETEQRWLRAGHEVIWPVDGVTEELASCRQILFSWSKSYKCKNIRECRSCDRDGHDYSGFRELNQVCSRWSKEYPLARYVNNFLIGLNRKSWVAATS